MKRVLIILSGLVLAVAHAPANAAEPPSHAADEAAIRKLIETYCAAFDRRDAKALAELVVARRGLHQPHLG